MQKEPLAFVYSQDSQKTTASWLCFCLLRAQVRMTLWITNLTCHVLDPRKGKALLIALWPEKSFTSRRTRAGDTKHVMSIWGALFTVLTASKPFQIGLALAATDNLHHLPCPPQHRKLRDRGPGLLSG